MNSELFLNQVRERLQEKQEYPMQQVTNQMSSTKPSVDYRNILTPLKRKNNENITISTV